MDNLPLKTRDDFIEKGIQLKKVRKVAYEKITPELLKCEPYIKKGWVKQNNKLDSVSNYIFRVDTYEKLLEEYNKNDENNKINNLSFEYVVHRFFNYKISTTIEKIITSYNICAKVPDLRDKEKDLYIYNVPFDIKVTVLPKKFMKDINYKYNISDLKKRKVRNELIRWLYENQSKEGRFHTGNRLFILCSGENQKNNNILSNMKKTDFKQIDEKVGIYLKCLHKGMPFNKVRIYNRKENRYVDVFSEIIFIS